MNLPNAECATVPKRKITHYLLNPAHPVGGSKAIFFLRFGFTAARWTQMAEALIHHARHNEVSSTETTLRGVRYAVDGPLPALDGTALNVRAAWFIDSGSTIPRFITAHPLPKL